MTQEEINFAYEKGINDERTRILEIINKMKYWDNPMDIDELINVEELKAKISQDNINKIILQKQANSQEKT